MSERTNDCFGSKEGFRAGLQGMQQRTAALYKALPKPMRALNHLSLVSYSDGSLSTGTKELMALAIAVATGCEGCALHHVEAARKHGVTREEVAESIGVAIAMGGGPSVVYGAIALAAFDEFRS